MRTTLSQLEPRGGLAKGMQSRQNMFLSQFWAELRIVYREGEQFAAAEKANVESLVNSRWLPWLPFTTRLVNKLQDRFPKLVTGMFKLVRSVWWFEKVIFYLLHGLKRGLVKIATTFFAWGLAAALVSFAFASWYGYLEGCRIELSQDGVCHYLDLVEETVLSSLGLGLTDDLKKIVGSAAHRGNVAAISHLGFSYLLFGVLVSMLYRKVTRG